MMTVNHSAKEKKEAENFAKLFDNEIPKKELNLINQDMAKFQSAWIELISHCDDLISLKFEKCRIEDFNPIKLHVKLKFLSLKGNRIKKLD